MELKGKFITFEGGEGSGKTTIIKIVADRLKELGYDVVITREPGGVEIAEQIRDLIHNVDNTSMDGLTEALLYAASRRQHLVEKVIPNLEQNKIILCDRFVDSSLVYQGYARGLGIENIWAINKLAIDNTMPDKTFLFNLEPEIGFKRIEANKEREINRLDLEDMSFHKKVHEGYKIIAAKYNDRIDIIDADDTIENISNNVITLLENIL